MVSVTGTTGTPYCRARARTCCVTGLTAWALYSSTFVPRVVISWNICAVSPALGSLPFSMAAAKPVGVTICRPAASSR